MRLIRRLRGAVSLWRRRTVWQVDMETARRLEEEQRRQRDT